MWGLRKVPKKAKELSALEVSRLTKPGRYAVGVVDGLHLEVFSTGARSWLLRIMIGGKRCDMGLGGYPTVTLAGARDAARQAREKVRSGINPIDELRATQSALKASQAAALTFKEAADKYIDAHKAGWSNEKHAKQWTSTLTAYAYPKIGHVLVRDVELPQVLAILEPIWKTKTETASRLRGRIESVLDWATARNYRQGLNPARWRGHLDKLLPKPSKVARVEHHDALPASGVGAFMAELRRQEGVGAKALEFAILTAARSGEVRGATWSEIDKAAKVWVIPGERMKAGREHRVPLTDQAIQILDALPRTPGSNFVFTAPRGGQLSDMTLSAVIRRMGAPCVPHGFRSSFRDWVSELTSYPSEMAEMALAHTINDKVEAAYRRGDLFEKRRQMMADWATFCSVAHASQPQT
jgi:integrase